MDRIQLRDGKYKKLFEAMDVSRYIICSQPVTILVDSDKILSLPDHVLKSSVLLQLLNVMDMEDVITTIKLILSGCQSLKKVKCSVNQDNKLLKLIRLVK